MVVEKSTLEKMAVMEMIVHSLRKRLHSAAKCSLYRSKEESKISKGLFLRMLPSRFTHLSEL